MLGSLRKFSTSIYAKILLGIIIIPFVFWGMGAAFKGGNKNIIVTIDKEKYSVLEFNNFIQEFSLPDQKIESHQIEEFLSAFIGDKLIEQEVEHFEIKLSDHSLRKLVKHQKNFKRKNKFSRIEYEKFLLMNNINAANFEAKLSKQEKKKQLLHFVGGGIMPSKFLVNAVYDEINQKRNIELINLNDIFKKKLNFSENQIKSYFENNKNKYKEVYKSVKLLELNPKKLIGNNEFNDLFFKKIDEIEDLIMRGGSFDDIIQQFNLEKPNLFTVNKFGKDTNSKIIKDFPENLITNVFDVTDVEPIALLETKDKYFIVEVFKTERIQRKIEDESLRKEILLNLEKKTKTELISEIVKKINLNNFTKTDFDKLSKMENVHIQKIRLEDRNDNKILKKELVDQIYTFSKRKVIVVNDISLSENFLIYIDNVENVTIDEKSEEYQKYLNLSKIKISNELYGTYDLFIKKRYKIVINYKTLEVIKNSFTY